MRRAFNTMSNFLRIRYTKTCGGMYKHIGCATVGMILMTVPSEVHQSSSSKSNGNDPTSKSSIVLDDLGAAENKSFTSYDLVTYQSKDEAPTGLTLENIKLMYRCHGVSLLCAYIGLVYLSRKKLAPNLLRRASFILIPYGLVFALTRIVFDNCVTYIRLHEDMVTVTVRKGLTRSTEHSFKIWDIEPSDSSLNLPSSMFHEACVYSQVSKEKDSFKEENSLKRVVSEVVERSEHVQLWYLMDEDIKGLLSMKYDNDQLVKSIAEGQVDRVKEFKLRKLDSTS